MLAIKNATVMVGQGDIIKDATLLIKDGKFSAVGSATDIPERCKVIDATDKVVTPGLIDVHTHLGVSEGGVGNEGRDFNETSDPITPEVRAIDGINPLEVSFSDAREAGVTTIQVMPGSANIIGGEMVVMKTAGKIVDEMTIKSPSGMKGAMGENPKRTYGSKNKLPITRMGLAARMREKFMEAEDYLNNGPNGKRDLGLEQLIKVLKKEIPMRIHAHRADDILTVLRLKQEFDFDLTIEHCTEGHKIADYIAQFKDVRVSIGPTMSTRSKVELKDKGWDTIKVLWDAGVPVSITTDHPVIGIEYLLTSAIYAIKHGLTEQQALQAITLNAANHIGVADRVGSIEVGKDADFVIWNGNPFDLATKIESVFIDGNKI